MSLWFRIIIIIAGALAPPFALQIYNELALHEARRTEMRHLVLDEADTVGRRLTMLADHLHSVLRATAAASADQTDTPARCAAVLGAVGRDLPMLRRLQWLTADGQVLCGVGDGAADGDVALTETQPVPDGRVLRGTLDPAWLRAQLAKMPLPQDTDVSVIDAGGNAVARWPAAAPAGRPTPAETWKLPLTPDRASREVVGPDAARRVVGDVPVRLDGADLSVHVSIGADVAYAAGDAEAMRGYTLTAASILTALALAIALTRGVITRPLLAILATTERWRAGDTSARVRLTRPRSEFGRIAHALNALLDAVASAQSRLRDRLAELDAVYHAAPVGLGFVDHALNYVTVNAALAEIDGIEAGAHRGLPIDTLLPDRAATLIPSIRAALAGLRVPPQEAMGHPAGPTDRPRRLLVSFQPAAAPGGAVLGAIMAVQEVTQLRMAEAALQEALQRANAELERRVAQRTAELEAEVREREATQAQLQQAQKMEVVGQLTGGVAHDFNNLLTSVIGNLELAIRRAQDRPDVIRLLHGALRSAERGATLTQRMLAFGRRQYLRFQPVDIRALLDGIADLLARTIGPRVTIRIDPTTDLPPALADPNQIELVILNLVVNARDAMPHGGTITIAAGLEQVHGATPHAANLLAGSYIRLSVSDTGIGMSAETMAHAFEPFFTTKPVGRGSGLGLSMVQGVAQQSGGAASIASVLGEGSTVTLWLPRADGIPAAPPAPAALERPATRVTGRTVLLAEDDPDVQAFTAACLEEAGFSVQRASSGRAALAALRARAKPPDLILADLAMPDLSGVDLARAARARFPGLPVLIVTGYNEPRGTQAEADLPVLGKPFKAAELVARVTALMQRTNLRDLTGVVPATPQDAHAMTDPKPAETQLDETVEDSFPASDPPSNTPPSGTRRASDQDAQKAARADAEDATPKGRPHSDRHAAETTSGRIDGGEPHAKPG